jgi:hypothetical protein
VVGGRKGFCPSPPPPPPPRYTRMRWLRTGSYLEEASSSSITALNCS